MSLETELTRRLKIALPIIQAPLAGGGDTPQLVAAVGEAGGLGSIGAGYLTGAQIAQAAKDVRARTSRPFAINLFAPVAVSPSSVRSDVALSRVAHFFAEVGIDPPSFPLPAPPDFEKQLKAALDAEASVLSFTFGVLPQSALVAIKARGVFLLGTATTVREAVILARLGVDAVIAQGSEAGGHRGTFDASFESSMVGTIALVPQIADAVRIPVVASGGIMDGRGLVAALALGAGAVQMGTAFLTCAESGVPDAYREAILRTREDQTRITRAFSGRPARGIVNRFMEEVEPSGGDSAVLPFPLQNALTRPLRSAAAKQNRAEFLSLWAGQGARMARRQNTAELVARIVQEAEKTLGALDKPAQLRQGA